RMIQAGQPICMLVPSDNVWVVANFKETQLGRMHPGQPARVSLDAYGGRPLVGKVQSISGGTGARFSLLPPENATGNFTKIVQRVPVRIQLQNRPADMALLAGMSVEVTVDVRH